MRRTGGRCGPICRIGLLAQIASRRPLGKRHLDHGLRLHPSHRLHAGLGRAFLALG